MRGRFVPLVLAAVVLHGPVAAAQTVIRTYETVNNLSVMLNYGSTLPQAVQSLGQTFMAPSHALALTDFTFWIARDGSLDAPSSGFFAELQQFDPVSRTTIGPSLFRELRHPDPRAAPGSLVFLPYTFTTGDLALQPGRTYLAFLTPVRNGNPPFDHEPILNANIKFQDPFPGGAVFYSSPFLAPSPWSVYPSEPDLMFEARFTTTPEPGTLAAVATGVLLLQAVRRRRACGTDGRQASERAAS